jgi:hypothetical protein
MELVVALAARFASDLIRYECHSRFNTARFIIAKFKFAKFTSATFANPVSKATVNIKVLSRSFPRVEFVVEDLPGFS